MNPVKMIRKLGQALRGGATFSQVFLGVFLGFAIGMMPGVSLGMLILFALLLLLNVNGGVASISLILGKVLCLVLAPITFHIGYALIHSIGLEGLIKGLANTPVLALLDLQVYCLIGGLPLTLVLGGVIAFLAASFFEKFQTATEKAGEECARYQKMMENKAVKAIIWLAFGQKKDEEKKIPSGLILMSRVYAGLGAMVVVCILSVLYLDTLARLSIVAGVQSMTGAEVNVQSASLSLTGGRLTVEGLQVTDPALPSHNQFAALNLTADIDMGALLTRRFIAEEIASTGVKTGVKRSSPGEVYVDVPAKTTPVDNVESMSTPEKIKHYYEKVKEVREQVKKLNDYLDSNDPATETAKTGADGKPLSNKDRMLEEAKLRGYLSLSAKESLSKHPGWLIRLISINQLEVNPAIPTLKVEGKNLSNAPSLVPEKRSITVKPDEEAVAALKKQIGGKVKGMLMDKAGSKLKGLFGK